MNTPIGIHVFRIIVPAHFSSVQFTCCKGKYSLESTDPRESEIRAPAQLTIALKLSDYFFIIAKLFKVNDGCLKFVYIKKSQVYGVFGQ